jgi:hypothetical protein
VWGCLCSDLKEGKIIMITPRVDGIWTLDSNRDPQRSANCLAETLTGAVEVLVRQLETI